MSARAIRTHWLGMAAEPRRIEVVATPRAQMSKAARKELALQRRAKLLPPGLPHRRIEP